MNSEHENQSQQLERPEVLRYSSLFKDRLAKQIRLKSLRASSVLTGRIHSGEQGFELESWDYLVERRQATDNSVTMVSVTRFPIDFRLSDTVSEGVRFVIANPRFTTSECTIEYHIATKGKPSTKTSVNKKETLALVNRFVSEVVVTPKVSLYKNRVY